MQDRFDPNIHHRRSIRWKGFDHSQAGCTSSRFAHKESAACFGEVKNAVVDVTTAGRRAGTGACPYAFSPRRRPSLQNTHDHAVHSCVKTDGWPSFDRRLWQRNYHERVIRDSTELINTQRYIHDNPLRWEFDRLNPNANVVDDKDPWL